MLVEYDFSTSLVLQHTVKENGTFDGSDVARPKLVTGAGDSEVIFKARKQVTFYDNCYIRMIQPPQDNPEEIVIYDPSLPRLDVILRTSGGAITSTAIQVATAVNTKGFHVTAAYGGTGLDVVSTVAGQLAGALILRLFAVQISNF